MANFGPFKQDEKDNIAPPTWEPKKIDYDQNKKEITDYFERRLKKLEIVKTTKTPRGQIIDWIKRESQGPIAKSSPQQGGGLAEGGEANTAPANQTELPLLAELQHEGVEVGPPGTVPVPRKVLDKLGFTKNLKTYLSKTQNHKIDDRGFAAPEDDGSHRYAMSH